MEKGIGEYKKYILPNVYVTVFHGMSRYLGQICSVLVNKTRCVMICDLTSVWIIICPVAIALAFSVLFPQIVYVGMMQVKQRFKPSTTQRPHMPPNENVYTSMLCF